MLCAVPGRSILSVSTDKPKNSIPVQDFARKFHVSDVKVDVARSRPPPQWTWSMHFASGWRKGHLLGSPYDPWNSPMKKAFQSSVGAKACLTASIKPLHKSLQAARTQPLLQIWSWSLRCIWRFFDGFVKGSFEGSFEASCEGSFKSFLAGFFCVFFKDSEASPEIQPLRRL